MKYTSFLLQATGLLLIVDGCMAGAESVEGVNPNDTKRALIGIRNWFKINTQTSLTPAPTPTGMNGYDPPPPPDSNPVPGTPTKFPTKPPTPFPTWGEPSSSPTSPTAGPTIDPSSEPSQAPTKTPTEAPSESPTVAPTVAPTPKPTKPRKTKRPTQQPTTSPSNEPTTREPTDSPTLAPFDETGGRSYFDFDLKKAVEEPDSKTIFEIVCDEDNAYLWGTLCTVLKEAETFGFLDSSDNQYALFAPTNEAFENSDYSLELLLKNKAAIQNLMATHITEKVLPYDGLTCDLSLEMLNYYYTNTLCIGSRKIQNADGNELRNLPIIDESANILANNGIIHPVSNLIIPFEFSVHTQLVDGSTGNSSDTHIVDTILHFVGNLTANQNDGDVSSTESDVDDSITASVVVEKDSTQSDFDGQSTIIADTSKQSTVGEVQVTLGDAIQSLSDVAADRDNISSDTGENTCQVCASQDECKHPRKATFLFPGEGPVLCSDVVDRQNSPKGIVLGQSMCSALQQRFNEYCSSAGN